ncbi:hypothetical protein [Halopiger aswanensis]|uniref:Uncharacterized protein n=1 Tax=Halopiger aswanensis TaxID=148449 RepID=A0A419WQL4_9EURY|nr:hypothetical protein [Halopiger aswanensis]RKD97696.1 hypothetical protein ATJ93_0687 [Halopiger aswanensis]
MTELTIPPDADDSRAKALVQEHVDVGDVVQIWEADRTGSDDPEHEGKVTGLEPGYLELDGQPLEAGSIRYDQIHSLIRLE